MNNLKSKRILLIDPPSVHHGPPSSIVSKDRTMTSIYSQTISEQVAEKLRTKGLECWNAVNTKYVSNYGLLSLGQALHNRGCYVKYENADYYISIDDYISQLLKICEQMDIICFTCTTPQFNCVLEIATEIRKRYPSLIFIIGGPHVSFIDEKEFLYPFDLVLKGYSVLKSADIICEGNLIRHTNKTRYIDVSGFDGVDEAFWLIPRENLYNTLLYTYASFGCPNSCRYCVEHKLSCKLNMFETNRVMKKVDFLVNECNVRFVHLADSDFFINKYAAKKLIEKLEVSSINACFSVNTNPKTLLDSDIQKLVSRFADLGLVELLIGVEYFSTTVLNSMNKYYDIKAFFEAILLIKKNNPKLIISFYSLVGLPCANKKTREENYEWFRRFFDNNLVDFSFHKFFVPYPGTDIYEHPEKFDVEIVHHCWSQYHRWALPRPIRIRGLTDDELLDEINDLYMLNIHNITKSKRQIVK